MAVAVRVVIAFSSCHWPINNSTASAGGDSVFESARNAAVAPVAPPVAAAAANSVAAAAAPLSPARYLACRSTPGAG